MKVLKSALFVTAVALALAGSFLEVVFLKLLADSHVAESVFTFYSVRCGLPTVLLLIVFGVYLKFRGTELDAFLAVFLAFGLSILVLNGSFLFQLASLSIMLSKH